MTETITVAKWLWSTLTADAALTAAAPGGVHEHPAPAEADGLFVTFQPNFTSDTLAVGGVRVLTRTEWLVRVTGRDVGPIALATAAARLDELLTGTCRNTSDGTIHSCTRLSPFHMTESADGVRYAHLGGIYRIHVT